MTTKHAILLTLAIAMSMLRAATSHGDDTRTVKVFVLAGQSNMEGKAPNTLLEYQGGAPLTRDMFAHLRKDDDWIVRDDVFIKFLERHGGLTIGYGSPGRTGLELEFGTVVGDHFQEPVLLIKAAWGGRSLCRDFRPPSAGLPGDERLQQELEQACKRVRDRNAKDGRDDPLPTMEDITRPYGATYRDMLAEVREACENYETLFPELQGRRLELAGFVWFQGWNDMFGGETEYESNMVHFIHDVRRDLNAPQLPVVIGALGQNGSKPAEKGMLVVQNAQLAMNALPEFQGNVKTVRTDVLVDTAAEALFPSWEERLPDWEHTGGDRPYHYLGSAIWFTRIGHALGVAMLELLANQPSTTVPE